ncbi:MAG TPA: transporter substrate-binding domain-containing protein [Candidatus Acidoferrales bacterium]|nr:transporter substrate-binding domain-containing protein [Candidatus Acidoferrales bacterium]
MKKTLTFLGLILFACAAVAAEPLRVGTSGDYAPFSFRDANGQLTGFDIDVAQRLAADLGRSAELVPFKWPELTSRIEHGDIDVAMSGVTQRADRTLSMLFSRPYAITGAVAVIRKSNHRRLPTLAALDNPTVKIAVNAGGHLEQVARRQFPQAQILSTTENATLSEQLRSGSVDAVVSEELEARTWGTESFERIGPFTRDRKAYAFSRGAAVLRQQVDDWLAARETDGWLDALRRKWLGESASMKASQACFEALAAAMDLRLQLMPKVAAVKRRDGLPIQDPQQEAAVLEKVKASAKAVDLNSDSVAQLFRVQIDAAVEVERRTDEVAPPELALADLRGAIAGLSQQEIGELGRCSKYWKDPAGRKQLRATLEHGIETPLPPQLVARMVTAVQQIR